MEETLVTKGQSSQLTCEMKAPSNSSIYWTHKQVNKKMCRVISLNETLVNIEMTPCDTTAVVYQREKVIDDKYSVYHLELQVSAKDKTLIIIIHIIADFILSGFVDP